MNFHATPALAAPVEIDLFGEAVQPCPTSRYRRRLAAVAGMAFELGARRARQEKRNAPAAVAFTARFIPSSAAAHELLDIARRIERLAPSHRSPHEFFELKSQLIYELRMIAKRK